MSGVRAAYRCPLCSRKFLVPKPEPGTTYLCPARPGGRQPCNYWLSPDTSLVASTTSEAVEAVHLLGGEGVTISDALEAAYAVGGPVAQAALIADLGMSVENPVVARIDNAVRKTKA